jgi:hypothetical protein
MVLGAVMRGEPGLGQRPGNVGGQRSQRVVGEPPGRVGEFFALSEGPQRPEVRRPVDLGDVVGEAAPDLVQTVL